MRGLHGCSRGASEKDDTLLEIMWEALKMPQDHTSSLSIQ